eukprot:2090040-Amphidinium_carterae.1
MQKYLSLEGFKDVDAQKSFSFVSLARAPLSGGLLTGRCTSRPALKLFRVELHGLSIPSANH